ncbi:MAG: hypothetical protein PVG35_17740 [Desulfobacterales bacterium]
MERETDAISRTCSCNIFVGGKYDGCTAQRIAHDPYLVSVNERMALQSIKSAERIG